MKEGTGDSDIKGSSVEQEGPSDEPPRADGLRRHQAQCSFGTGDLVSGSGLCRAPPDVLH